MKLEDQVLSIEQVRELQELGFDVKKICFNVLGYYLTMIIFIEYIEYMQNMQALNELYPYNDHWRYNRYFT